LGKYNGEYLPTTWLWCAFLKSTTQTSGISRTLYLRYPLIMASVTKWDTVPSLELRCRFMLQTDDPLEFRAAVYGLPSVSLLDCLVLLTSVSPCLALPCLTILLSLTCRPYVSSLDHLASHLKWFYAPYRTTPHHCVPFLLAILLSC